MTSSSEEDAKPSHRFGVPAVDLLAQFWNDPVDYAARSPKSGSGPSTYRRALTLLTVLMIGFLLTVAYRQTAASASESADARQQLREDIAEQRNANSHSNSDADRLRDEVNDLRDKLIGGEKTVNELHDAEALAGLRAVTGDGITVTITNGPSPSDPSKSDLGQVYDRDLQLVVNAIWAYGGEAIAVDDQRLTADSSIRAAGDAILVDFTPVTSPYKIAAIGPPDLAQQLRDSDTANTFSDYEKRYGITMTIDDSDGLKLPAASAPAMDNAKPGESN